MAVYKSSQASRYEPIGTTLLETARWIKALEKDQTEIERLESPNEGENRLAVGRGWDKDGDRQAHGGETERRSKELPPRCVSAVDIVHSVACIGVDSGNWICDCFILFFFFLFFIYFLFAIGVSMVMTMNYWTGGSGASICRFSLLVGCRL